MCYLTCQPMLYPPAGRGCVVGPCGDEEPWHRAAVQRRVAVASESEPLRPGGTAQLLVLRPGAAEEGEAALVDHAARGVSSRAAQGALVGSSPRRMASPPATAPI